MSLLFLILFAVNSDKVVEVRYIEEAPVIDGVIEEIWSIADSAIDFIQILPYEKESPTERTVVYLMQDEDNLYVAFCAYTEKYKCVSCLGGREDYVTLFLDTFGSRNTAYYFTVNASGQTNVESDGLILDDGRRRNDTWDGICYQGVKLYDNYYIVEFKIPFKSIRYKKGLSKWGVNFRRYILKNNEQDCWTEVDAINMDIVSEFGTLKGISPKVTGYHFELFPEGFVRYDKHGNEEGIVDILPSLNFKWDFTSEGTVNATVNPDFAQIEADPFTLNLSRYPVYLEERRPFFLEGNEIFRFSNFEQGRDFYSPLNIFYSRKIGKSVDGEPVPILGGLKLTSRTKNWNL
ncbi:carbohydrate binding family 9 domain-containing protein [candidate division WOR-3 bacterium]|nr:carbohydrate binding family 9 domain-containing protein [candidate division WOR-3 bacterium]